MFTFQLAEHRYHKIHFIGIGGVSMSGIAELLLANDYVVEGSDREESDKTEKLAGLGAKIYIGQKKENLNNPDLIVYTDAILPDNEELVAARSLGVPCVTRGVFLGALMRNYKHSIAISGSHGKSTTTSILSKILVNSPMDPTILLGGSLDEINGNVQIGQGEYLVTEACEFKANILYYYPSTVIILNIDEDHLDFYKSIDHIVDTFIGYMKNLDSDGKAIINLDDPNCHPLLDQVEGEVITFGMDNAEATYNITNIAFNDAGHPRFDLIMKDGRTEHFEMSIIGRYNIYNGVAAVIAAYETGIDLDTIRTSLKEYSNLHRRMEVYGEVQGATIMTDYGHHPTEILSTLEALSEQTKNKLICVFQPHTFSRTKKLMDRFAEAFYAADEVIVTDIYAAREKFDPTIHSTDLVERLVANGVNARYIGDFESARDYVYDIAQQGDVVITTGCGNPHVLAHMIVDDYVPSNFPTNRRLCNA